MISSSYEQNNRATGMSREPRREKAMATVDARPIIASGDEPFETIMAAATALEEGEELVVLAPFEPVPLEGVLSSQGFSYEVEDLGQGDWQVTFRRLS
jgi:uncharacterized protein (DUF2249 family)